MSVMLDMQVGSRRKNVKQDMDVLIVESINVYQNVSPCTILLNIIVELFPVFDVVVWILIDVKFWLFKFHFKLKTSQKIWI